MIVNSLAVVVHDTEKKLRRDVINVENEGSPGPWHPSWTEAIVDDVCANDGILKDDRTKGVGFVPWAQAVVQIGQVITTDHLEIETALS